MAISDTTKVSKGQEPRSRRQVERANNILGADGSPASDPYKNTEGLRIYDTWFQDEQSIPYTGPAAAQGLDQPIRPHHRYRLVFQGYATALGGFPDQVMTSGVVAGPRPLGSKSRSNLGTT